LDEIKKQHSKNYIHVYNEITLLKRKLHKAHHDDSVYASKIKKDRVADFNKTIVDVHEIRKRTVSNIQEAISVKDVVSDISRVEKRAQNKGEKHYYPDLPKSLETNFGQNENDEEELSWMENDYSRFMESLNSNKDQWMVKYYPEIKSAVQYNMEHGLWEPKLNLVTTIYDHNSTFNKIIDLEVSQDSKYFISIANSKLKIKYL
jgi:hypothetical protein